VYNRKKLIIILSVLTVTILLCGAKWYDVELRTKEPFVDLTKVISKGGQVMPNGAVLSDYETVEEAKKNEETDKPSGADTEAEEPVKTSVAIRIHDQQIYVDGVKCALTNFDRVFQNAYKKGMTAEITDDYGEYQTFTGVIKQLEKNSVKYHMTGENR